VNPDSCADRLQQAQVAFDTGAYSRAAQEFARALAACPQRDEILISLGQTQYLAGDEAAAEQTLLRANRTAARYALGRIFYEQARYTEAAAQFEQVVAREPDNYRAHDNLALCYDALQRDADALRHFFQALDLVKEKHREYEWPYANLAEFYLKREQFEKAFQLAAEAAERNPGSARNFFLTGHALLKLGRLENSLKWLRRAVDLDPAHAEAQFQLGQALRRLGRAGESAAHLEKFRELKARESSTRDRRRPR
jgi:tetratricopeptide (TPR) repeat protein